MNQIESQLDLEMFYSQKMKDRKDVSIVIIGSGISGFTAATKLVESGFLNVIVLEAENRIGGRIFTTNFADGRIDSGAQWCHGINGNIVHSLAGSESFAETKMDFSKMTFTRSDGTLADPSVCRTLMELCNDVLGGLKEGEEGPIDELLTHKFFEALQGNQFKDIDRKIAFEVLENFKKRESSYCGCESLKNIFVSGFQKFQDCDGPTWLNWKGKGYKTIFDCVLKQSKVSRSEVEKKIQLNTEVVNIDWESNSTVTVRCSDGEVFVADHVIITVSLGVLKASHLKLFTPLLPIEKQQAIENISFGAVGKIFLTFDKPFWPEDWVGFSLLWSDADLREIEGTENSWLSNIYCFYTVDFLPNVLLARLAGDKIAEMEALSDEAIIKSCQFVFKRFLPSGLCSEIVDVMTSKWKTNKNFGGTYSYHSQNDSSVENLAAPAYDREARLKLLFAGEATHELHFSTVHGAIGSAYREADRLTVMYSS